MADQDPKSKKPELPPDGGWKTTEDADGHVRLIDPSTGEIVTVDEALARQQMRKIPPPKE